MAQVRPTVSSDGRALVNPYSFGVEVLVVHDSGRSVDRFQSVTVAAASTEIIGMPAGSRVDALTPLNPEVTTKSVPACPAGAGSIRLTPALVHEEIAVADRGGVDSVLSKKLEELAQEQGAIELAQHLDEAKVRRNDPVAAELRREEFRDADPATRDKMIQEDNQARLDSMVETAVYYAAANGDVLLQHDENAGAEAQQVGKMVEQRQGDLAALEAAYAAANSRLAAGRDFTGHSAVAIAQAPGFQVPAQIPADMELGRVCGGAANDQDFIAIRSSSDPGVSTFLGRAAFDHGGSEELVFHRVAGTSQWVATLYWPLESSKARVSLRVGKGLQQVGSIEAGRPSVQQQFEAAKKAVGSLKSRKRNLDFGSNGGDEVKTTIVP